MATLLEKAKAFNGPNKVGYPFSARTLEECQLFIAWLHGEVDNYQVAKVLGVSAANSIPAKLGPVFKEMVKFGRLRIEIIPEVGAEKLDHQGDPA